MDERRRLKRLSGRFSRPALSRKSSQLVVDHRQQFVSRLWLARSDIRPIIRDLTLVVFARDCQFRSPW